LKDPYYIKRARKGDMDAFTWLMDRYKPMAYSMALRMLKDREEAEEVVQKSFIKAFQSISRFREESCFSTWLFRIVYNNSISVTRKKKRKGLPLDQVSQETANFVELDNALKQLEEKDRRVFIQKALQQLDETDFTILSLFYYEDKPLKEISKITGIKYSCLKVRLQRARKKLHHELKILMKTEIYDLL